MAIWWRLRHGSGGLAALMFMVLVMSPLAAYSASHAVRNDNLVYWRDVTTGFAIGGYDPVAYFVDATPRLGVTDFEYDWQGVTWRFVSAANRAVFVRDPTVYAPQYGGYGARSVADGVLALGRPADWLIQGDRLFLFANAERRRDWIAQSADQRRAANKFWPKINRVLPRN